MSKVLVRLSEQKQKDYRLLALEDLIDILPHGSGFDGDWTVDTDSETYPNAIILSNGYHAMDGNGFYSGWLNFDIFIGKPDLADVDESCNPTQWYHTFDIEYDASDLDYDDDSFEISEDDHPDDFYENTAVNLESLKEYIEDTISESLMGITSAVIVLEDEE
jgi:hypothetical protein